MSQVQVVYGLQRERLAYLFLQYGRLDVLDGAFVLEDINGVRVQLPIGSVTALFLEPGTSVTHAAASLAAACDTMLLFVGEAATRTYAVGRSASGEPQNLLVQTTHWADPVKRLQVIHRMYALRFGDVIPSRRSVEQLRGIEGARVREAYKILARQHGIEWKGRSYDSADWATADPINRALSAANACMHGLCEAVVVACGYSPVLGFIHTGGRLSFIYDIADLYKLQYCAPAAFRLVGRGVPDVEVRVRHELREQFRSTKLVSRIAADLDALFPAEAKP